jgi:hypothetical protein
MKKILLIITLLVITSCKTSKASCDAYGSVNHENSTLNNDTLVLHQKNLSR